MPESIAFRPRARGCATAGGVGNSYLEPRLQFAVGVTGVPDVGEVKVGDGTDYPLQLTVAEMMELYYRVNDSTLSGSGFLRFDPGPGNFDLIVLMGSGAPSASLFDDNTTDYTNRSYTKDDPPVSLTDALEVWTETHNLPQDFQSFAAPSTYPAVSNHSFVNGFSLLSAWDGSGSAPTTGYTAYAYFEPTGGGTITYVPAFIECLVSPVVGVVDNVGNGDPFDPLNERWAAVYFRAYANTDPTGTGVGAVYTCDIGSVDDPLATDQVTAGTLEFILQSTIGDAPSVQLYNYYALPEVGAGGTYTFTATGWWPYAKINGDPAWDSATGEPL